MGRVRGYAWGLRLSAQGPYRRSLAALERAERLPPEGLLALREERLRSLLLHAHGSTAYYRPLLEEHGVVSRAGDVDLDRFPELPLLDKPVIRDEFERLKSSDLADRDWRVRTTGGSTGEPSRFVQDAEYKAWVYAMGTQVNRWAGYRFGDRRVLLWSAARDVDGGGDPLRIRLGRRIRNEIRLPAFPVTDADLAGYAHRINAYRPVQLLSYPETVYELCLVIQRQGIAMHPLRCVVTSGGTLYPRMRTVIEDTFETRVFDRYGSTEVGGIAQECEHHHGLHVGALCQHVEILRPDGDPVEPGEEGEVVITNLANYAMPLIRYRIGDLGTWTTDPCPCGRSGPLLARVTGRTMDTFVRDDGGQVDGGFFLFVLDSLAWVRRFRVVQEARDRVDVFLQPWHEPSAEELRELDGVAGRIKGALGEACAVNFQVVSEIPASPSGKHLYVVSKVRRLEARS